MGKQIRWLAVLVAVGGAWADDVSVSPAGEAKVYLRLYRDEDLTTEVGSPLGGVVYPVLSIELGPGWGLSSTNSLVVKVKDEYPNYVLPTGVEGASTEFSWPAIALTADGWEHKSVAGDTWWSGGPGSGANSEAQVMFLRYKLDPWNSMTTPLGNNGDHTVSLTQPVTFQGPNGATAQGDGSKAVKTENVYVSNVKASSGTVDYFLWRPMQSEALAHPTIQFAIRDADPQHYEWRIRFRPTTVPGPWAEGAFSEVYGSTGCGRVVVDVTDPALSGHLDNSASEETRPTMGPYTYDITVSKFLGHTSKRGRRSSGLLFAEGAVHIERSGTGP